MGTAMFMCRAQKVWAIAILQSQAELADTDRLRRRPGARRGGPRARARHTI